MKILIYSAIAGVALITANSVGAASRNLLTENELRQLALEGVRVTAPGALKYKVGFERFREFGYDAFEGWINVGEGHVGVYAIDRRTGDMWDGVTECGQITSPEIKRLQRKFRQRLGLSQAQYVRIKRHGPICEPLAKTSG